MNRHLLLLMLALLGFSIPTLSAQEGPIGLSFRVMSLGKGNFKEIYYLENPSPSATKPPKLKPIRFNHMNRSVEWNHYKGPNPIVFYRTEGKDERGWPILNPIGEAYIPAGMKKALLFFSKAGTDLKSAMETVPGKEELAEAESEAPTDEEASDTDEALDTRWKPEMDIFPLDDSANGFPADHVLFLNTTKLPLFTQFGDEKLVLKPGVTGPRKIARYFNRSIFVGMLIRYNDSNKVVLKNQWEFTPGYRYMMIIKPPKREGSWKLQIFRITDYVAENKEFNPDYVEPEAQEN